MNVIATPSVLTAEQMLELEPEDGIDYELIRGLLVEKPVTTRNPNHTLSAARIAQYLSNWVDEQPLPRGQIHTTEVRCRIRKDPDTVVGIDVAYIGGVLATSRSKQDKFIDGIPILAVEILSPSDRQEEISNKIQIYQAAKVPVIWIVDTDDCTVRVYRLGQKPVLFNDEQTIQGDPELPGFVVDVAKFFA